jgi:hypothetical protein
MASDRGFRTGSGIARVRGGDLVVERSPRAFLAGWYDRTVASASRARATWNLLRVSLAAWTLWQFGWMLRDGVQSGVVEYLAVVVVVLLPVALAVRLYREAVRTTTVPLEDVDRAVVDPSGRTLTLHHGEATDVDLRGDDDIDAAREHLRLRGVEVVDADDEPNHDETVKPWQEGEDGTPTPGDEGDVPDRGGGERRPDRSDDEGTPGTDDPGRSRDAERERATGGPR